MNKGHVLAHQVKRKLGRVVRRLDLQDLPKKSRSNHRRLGKNVKEKVAIQVKVLAQRHGLSKGLHIHAEQEVGHELHSNTGGGRAHQVPPPSDRLKDSYSAF